MLPLKNFSLTLDLDINSRKPNSDKSPIQQQNLLILQLMEQRLNYHAAIVKNLQNGGKMVVYIPIQ